MSGWALWYFVGVLGCYLSTREAYDPIGPRAIGYVLLGGIAGPFMLGFGLVHWICARRGE